MTVKSVIEDASEVINIVDSKVEAAAMKEKKKALLVSFNEWPETKLKEEYKRMYTDESLVNWYKDELEAMMEVLKKKYKVRAEETKILQTSG